MTYAEKLKSPLWQRKRLEILKEANFTCEECDSKERTLHVHHCYYEKGKMPWDYPPNALKCLCEDCHLDRHEKEQSIQRILSTLNLEEIDTLHCDVLYAISMHGILKVAKKCRSLGA